MLFKKTVKTELKSWADVVKGCSQNQANQVTKISVTEVRLMKRSRGLEEEEGAEGAEDSVS